MEIPIIKIGNSKGIILSKTILEKYHIKDRINIEFNAEDINLKPLKNPRENWEEQFKEMRKKGDDALLINDVFKDEEFKEWE